MYAFVKVELKTTTLGKYIPLGMYVWLVVFPSEIGSPNNLWAVEC